WVATEWVGAETLADFAKRQGKFEPDVAAGIGCGILDALTELHEAGLAHGGLRPSNIHLSQGFLPGGVILAHPGQYHLFGAGSLVERAKNGQEDHVPNAHYLAPE